MPEKLLTKAQANRIVDIVLHPHMDDKKVVLLDEALHAMIEQDSERTVRKALNILGRFLF